ncbi:MAG: hypothetical protein ACEQSB_05450 [Undibacterium sp.]
MSRLLIHPTFNGSLVGSAIELCDFFLIREDSAVPVETFTITVDGERSAFPVEAGRYKTALFLLYCAVLSHRGTRYAFAPFYQKYTAGYYGHQILVDAAQPETKHTAVRLLMSRGSVDVELTLRSGYVLPENKGRTLQELIEFGWQIRDVMQPERPAPLIRAALEGFTEAVSRRQIDIVDSPDPNEWPSLIWMERVQTLSRSLGMFATA